MAHWEVDERLTVVRWIIRIDAMSITPEVSAKTLTQLVALQIKHAMVDADIRQAELARRSGKTEQWLSVRLRGVQPIDVNDMHLIALALGVGVHELLPPPEVAATALKKNLVQPQVPARKHVVRPIPDQPITRTRTDSVRPISTIPMTRRRPVSTRPAGRPMAG